MSVRAASAVPALLQHAAQGRRLGYRPGALRYGRAVKTRMLAVSLLALLLQTAAASVMPCCPLLAAAAQAVAPSSEHCPSIPRHAPSFDSSTEQHLASFSACAACMSGGPCSGAVADAAPEREALHLLRALLATVSANAAGIRDGYPNRLNRPPIRT